MTTPDDPLDRLLEQWEKAPPALRPVTPEVWRRAAAAEAEATESSRPARRWRLWAWGAGGAALAAACVAVGLAIAEARFSRFKRDYNALVMQSYLRLIDPLVEARAAAPVDPAAELAGLQQDLRLSPDQLGSLRALYERSSPRLRELAAQEARLREELYAFEELRRSGGQVDFIEFARFVGERRRLERECAESTQRLVDASADLMNLRQRERYLILLNSARSLPGARWAN